MVMLKKYQQEASDKLLDFMSLPEAGTAPIIGLSMPTGAGKTTTIAHTLKEYFDKEPKSVALFVSKNVLTSQAYNSFLKVFPKNSLHNVNDNYTLPKTLKVGDIIFPNWEKMNNPASEYQKLLHGTESMTGLVDLLIEVHAKGYNVVLVIDESHLNMSTLISQNLIYNIFKPNHIITVSATINHNTDMRVSVDYDTVAAAGMVPECYVINKGVESTTGDSRENILTAAINVLNDTKKMYASIQANVNPLMLIQVSNDEEIKFVKNFLSEHNFSDDEVAVWTAKEKSDAVIDGSIKVNDSPVRFLIFKEAVATGIDLPRANTLVMFRRNRNPIFNLQVVGRISRQPEAVKYDIVELNQGFVFTDIPDNMINKIKFDSLDKKYFNISENKLILREDVTSVKFNLPNVHVTKIDNPMLKIVNMKNILAGLTERLGSKKFNYNPPYKNIIVDANIHGSNMTDGKKFTNSLLDNGTVRVNKTLEEVRNDFRSIVRESFEGWNTQGLEAYSEEIFKRLLKDLNIEVNNIQSFVVANSNIICLAAKSVSVTELETSGNSENVMPAYNPPAFLYYHSDVSNRRNRKASYVSENGVGYLSGKVDSIKEEDFDYQVAEYDNVKAIIENGKEVCTSFGVGYDYFDERTQNIVTANTFPDRLVLLEDNTLVLAEIKNGWTADIAGAKYSGLKKAADEINQKIMNSELDTNICRVVATICEVNGSSIRCFVGEEYTTSLTDSGWVDFTEL